MHGADPDYYPHAVILPEETHEGHRLSHPSGEQTLQDLYGEYTHMYEPAYEHEMYHEPVYHDEPVFHDVPVHHAEPHDIYASLIDQVGHETHSVDYEGLLHDMHEYHDSPVFEEHHGPDMILNPHRYSEDHRSEPMLYGDVPYWEAMQHYEYEEPMIEEPVLIEPVHG